MTTMLVPLSRTCEAQLMYWHKSACCWCCGLKQLQWLSECKVKHVDSFITVYQPCTPVHRPLKQSEMSNHNIMWLYQPFYSVFAPGAKPCWGPVCAQWPSPRPVTVVCSIGCDVSKTDVLLSQTLYCSQMKIPGRDTTVALCWQQWAARVTYNMNVHQCTSCWHTPFLL